MYLTIQVLAVFLAAIAMSLALAHALELPGKLRLDKQTYRAVQPIYYPGFTIGGGVGEGLGMVAALVLLLLTPRATPAFWWTLAGLLALVAMHAVFWVFTQPVNRYWLQEQQLHGPAADFFALRAGKAGDDWVRLRNRWEYSHVARALLSGVGLIALIVAVAL
jgi:hypothetical protein